MGGFNAAHGAGQNINDNLSNANSYSDSANFFCDGSVVSMCSTPNPFSGIRDIWLVVKRSVGSGSIYSVERIIGANTVKSSAYNTVLPGTAAQEPMYLDCAYYLSDQTNPANFTYPVGNGQMIGQVLQGVYYSSPWENFCHRGDGPRGRQWQYHSPVQHAPRPRHGEHPCPDRRLQLPQRPYSPCARIPRALWGLLQGAIKRVSKAYVRAFTRRSC